MKRYVWFLVLAVAGCATAKATINTFVDPTFDGSSVRSLAIFPIINARLAPSEGQQVNRRIGQALRQRDPTLRLMGSAEAISRLNDHDLAEEWAYFLTNYVSSGVPDVNA